jgi:23S rRNA (uracil1939-C5)-methyltransferase
MSTEEDAVEIVSLASAGEGVGRFSDGRVVFVAGALPGDVVKVGSLKKKKKVLFGSVDTILTSSVDRVTSRCEVSECGGCPLRELSWDAQHRVKRQRVIDALRRIGGMDIEQQTGSITTKGEGWHYRHRVRLHAQWMGSQWNIGYHKRQSHEIQDFRECMVLLPPLETMVRQTKLWLEGLLPQSGLRSVEIALGKEEGVFAVKLQGSGTLKHYQAAYRWVGEHGLIGVEVVARDGHRRYGNIELMYDHGHARCFDATFEPGLFTQAFPACNDELVARVLKRTGGATDVKVLEFHAGVGTFSLPLLQAGARVWSVELDQRALALAEKNARKAGFKLHAYRQSDQNFLSTSLGQMPEEGWDVCLLDPPRTGAKQVAMWLRNDGPKKVVYVSCDPATLARDVKTMAEGGYSVEHVDIFDMFPQTSHVESVVTLKKIG